MLRDKIARAVEEAAIEAQKKGLLPQVGLPEIVVERPQNATHGDYASSLPLKLARSIRANPLDIAQILAKHVALMPEVESIEVAPPGFINFTLNRGWLAEQVGLILRYGEKYGDSEMGKGARVQLEFVSVNPTGPLHVGHGRGAILGDTLANVLRTAGYSVEKEYYVNDAGNQMESFYRSLYARYCQCLGRDAEIPTDGYQGAYVVELARKIIGDKGDYFLHLPDQQA
ncbi:MAG: arginine--tRNA ligase, partial [Chloroflexi bacterium]|nr:arginine--tRNA ligase [Chloroflexota bacterium]